MSFKKYPSIENSYRQREIDTWLKYYPELANEQFVATCKIDGCNTNIWFYPNGEIKIGKKTTFIGYINQDVFFQGVNVSQLLKSNDAYLQMLNYFSKLSSDFGNVYTLYGELFGKGIQKRVNYGDGKYFRAFDLMIDEKIVSFKEFRNHFESIGDIPKADIYDLMIPKVGFFHSLEEALAFNVIFKSLLTPEGYDKDNFEEGVVIKPYNKVYTSPQGSIFYLKKKNPKFADKEGTSEKEKRPVDEGLKGLNQEFRSYINENRVLDVFSKYGTISQMSQIGDYIRYVIEDAKEDFLKDNDFTGDKSAEKIVYNCGSLILDILKKHL